MPRGRERELMKRPWFSKLILLVVIAVLGSAVIAQQRKEKRLRAVLALYRSRSHRGIVSVMGRNLPLAWPDETPLAEVIEQIKQLVSSRSGMFPKGVPIYVDPNGLRQAGKSLRSPVKAPPSDPLMSLREKLRIVFEPLGLCCQARDGALIITAHGLGDESVRDELGEDEE
jgi:hypothetical protein